MYSSGKHTSYRWQGIDRSVTCCNMCRMKLVMSTISFSHSVDDRRSSILSQFHPRAVNLLMFRRRKDTWWNFEFTQACITCELSGWAEGCSMPFHLRVIELGHCMSLYNYWTNGTAYKSSLSTCNDSSYHYMAFRHVARILIQCVHGWLGETFSWFNLRMDHVHSWATRTYSHGTTIH
jgi:hypothetical protein